MRSPRILGISLLVVLLSSLTVTCLVVPARAATIRVPQDYSTIQAAVTAAKAGDTIQVAAGTYYENVLVSIRVIIAGEGSETTIVDGRGKDTVFNIQADDVEISGLTIRNGGRRFNGINVYYPYGGAKIHHNSIKDNVVGVVLSQSGANTVESNVMLNNSMYGVFSNDFSVDNIVKNNTISGSAYGVALSDTSSSDAVENTIYGTSYGVYVAYSNGNNVSANKATNNSWNVYFSSSNSNIVENNYVSGGSVGIQVMHSEGNTLMNNTASGSSYGIYLGDCGVNTVSGNAAFLNDWGIDLYNSTGSTVKENVVNDNAWGFYVAENSKGNYIYHNNVLVNVKQVFQDPNSGQNIWRTPTLPYQGNHWSDYKGSDTNGDGIGDTYLPWSGVDWYPLVAPWGTIRDISIKDVTSSATSTYIGRNFTVNVEVKNEGTDSESFPVTLRYENTTLGVHGTVETQVVTDLSPGTSTTLVFHWNTTGLQLYVEYTLIANASILSGELDQADNVFTDGKVKVKGLGDINGDRVVNIDDLAAVAIAYGTKPGDGLWNSDADLNQDNKVDIDDIIIVSLKYGQIY